MRKFCRGAESEKFAAHGVETFAMVTGLDGAWMHGCELWISGWTAGFKICSCGRPFLINIRHEWRMKFGVFVGFMEKVLGILKNLNLFLKLIGLIENFGKL
jgi:hypothetical protein